MKRLRVLYSGWGERWPLGLLADNGRELLFEYDPEALRQGLQLSPLRLPLQPQAFGGYPLHQQRLPGVVADALPDGWGLLLMDRLFRRQGLDPAALSPLDRLAFIGDRAMGALSFEPADPLDLPAEDVDLLALAQQAQLLINDHDSTALRQLAVMGGSPQGARPKVLVQFNPTTGMVHTMPTADAGFEPWLVKFQSRGEHPEACAVEALYAWLAARCGLEVPATRHFDLGPRLAAFGIARFDREAGQRVPVHTLAGALHADFRLPGAVDYGSFLRVTRLFTRDEREVRKAFERAAFNVLFNNRDDHPKNLSFRLGKDRQWRLAPCYDLTFAEGMGGEHAMDVCGHGRNITRALMLQLAEQGGLKRAWAGEALDRLATEAEGFKAALLAAPIRRSTALRMAAAVQANQGLWA